MDKDILKELADLEVEIKAKVEAYNRISKSINLNNRLGIFSGEDRTSLNDCRFDDVQDFSFWYPSSWDC
jgi:hypothetical protein